MPTNIKEPLFILGVAPSSKVEFENFFDSSSTIVDLLRNPPYLRYSGWNMLTLDTPKIIKGKCWEVRNGDRKTIRLYKDGSFVSVVYADNTFLGWGQDDANFAENPRINTLALIEYVYEFVSLYVKLIANSTSEVNQLRFDAGISNALVGEKPLGLVPQKINNPFFYNNFDKGEVTEDFKTTVFINYEKEKSIGIIAYKILEVIFTEFGIPSDKIPYTNSDEKGNKYVEVEQIPNT